LFNDSKPKNPKTALFFVDLASRLTDSRCMLNEPGHLPPPTFILAMRAHARAPGPKRINPEILPPLPIGHQSPPFFGRGIVCTAPASSTHPRRDWHSPCVEPRDPQRLQLSHGPAADTQRKADEPQGIVSLLSATWRHTRDVQQIRVSDRSLCVPERDASRSDDARNPQVHGIPGSRKGARVQKDSCCLHFGRQLFSITYAGRFCSWR
jgi:hypothetical protein